MEHSLMSAYAMDSSTGEVVIDINADLSVIPASCLKIVTTGAALHLLDPNSRFETHLEIDGEIDDAGMLHGNIIVKGGGDPCLGSDRIEGNPDWKRELEIWVDAVQACGIKEIEGDLIADATCFEKAMAAPSWSWEDLGNYYGAGASGLSFCENKYEIFFKPGLYVGDDVTMLRTNPPFLGPLVIENELKTGPENSGDRAWIFGSEFSQIQHIRGTIPFGVEEFSIKGAIPDPGLLVKLLFVRELEERGIVLHGGKIEGNNCRKSIHVTYSPTIEEMIYWANQKSINLYTEHLLKKMGEGSALAGLQVVADFWREKGVDWDGFYLADGSGLSRRNLVTAKGMGQILVIMKNSPFFSQFFASLRNHLDLITAKDGKMSFVKGYAGYTEHAVIVIFINHCADEKEAIESVKRVLLEVKTVRAGAKT